MKMEKTAKYKIKELRTAVRKSDGQEITVIEACNEETDQICRLYDFELKSMRLGDELEITVKNNE